MKTILALLVFGAMASASAFAAKLPLSVLGKCGEASRRTTVDEQIRACTLVIETEGQDPAERRLALLARVVKRTDALTRGQQVPDVVDRYDALERPVLAR